MASETLGKVRVTIKMINDLYIGKWIIMSALLSRTMSQSFGLCVLICCCVPYIDFMQLKPLLI